jgi:hypothetical protein
MKKTISTNNNQEQRNIVKAVISYFSWRKLDCPYELKLLMTSLVLVAIIGVIFGWTAKPQEKKVSNQQILNSTVEKNNKLPNHLDSSQLSSFPLSTTNNQSSLKPLTPSADSTQSKIISSSLPKVSNSKQKKQIPSTTELTYKHIPSHFSNSQKLQEIVNAVIQEAKQNNLPMQQLSITLIDVNTGTIAGYQQQNLRYPASVVKLFWMVALYNQIYAGLLQQDQGLFGDLEKMIKESDNDAGSRILNAITKTTSGSKLPQQEYQAWLKKRTLVNRFFQSANYEGIDVSHKTFPVRSEGMSSPQGRDLQMRGNIKKQTRNKISTEQAARLMYEITSWISVSPEYSQHMAFWLVRDLRPEAWENIDPNTGRFNPIKGFLGESLPTNVVFLSKAGWTSKTRQEVAYVNALQTAYILAVFGEDKAYAQNWEIFPKISSIVYQKMHPR